MVAVAKTKGEKGFRSTLEDRFKGYINRTDSCWLWIGPVTNMGYGVLSDGRARRGLLAHRLAWEYEHGAIPIGLEVCHVCDVPLCVRPSHLFLGTQSENMKDFWTKHPSHKGALGSVHSTEWKQNMSELISRQYRTGIRHARPIVRDPQTGRILGTRRQDETA